MNKIVKIGLLGIGKMGLNHLRNLSMLKDVEISFIFDTNEELLAQTSKNFSLKASSDLSKDLLQSDGVIIVTPTFTHFDYINNVSDCVKNIFVEKPLTDSIETTNIIASMAKTKNLNIQVGLIERYNPAIVALIEILKNNKKVINIDFIRTNKMSSRITDVDVVMDLMIHDIDLSLLLNGMPKKIYAHGYIVNGMIEYARALITHENGAFSNILASRITEKRIRQVSVTCDDMYIDCNLLSKELLVNRQTVEQHLENVSISSKTESIEVRPQESLLLELMDFVKICSGQKDMVSSKCPNEQDGKKAMEVAVKIQNLIKGVSDE